MPPNQQNPYDFIVNNQQPKRGINPSSKTTRIAVVVAGVILLIILAVIANKILSAGDNAQRQKLTEVAKAEAEIIRVSTLGAENAKDRDTMALASTAKLTVQSSQNQTKKLLEKRGVNPKGFTKLISGSKNSKTDAQLEEGGRNNRYDETFKAVITKQLADYQKLLKAANDSGVTNEQKVLAKSYSSAGLLLPSDSSDDL